MSLEQRRFLRPPKASKRVGLSESYMAHLRVQGGGPPFCKVGKVVLYDIVDLDDWVIARKRRSTSEGGDAS